MTATAALVAVGMLLGAAAARADVTAGRSAGRAEGLTPGGESTVDLGNGAFRHAVDIDVPDFHDLEPDLSLDYSSARGNGTLGIGWSLEGFSTIERAGATPAGSRRCAASDTFVLDGQPLVACTTLGGTHCTKAQSYRRIVYDAAADAFTIWNKDGTRLSYAKIFAPPAASQAASCSYRYGLTAMQDALGNKVTYSWWTDPVDSPLHQEVYPDRVTYNGVTVALYRELRPDGVTYANGLETTSQRYRLKTIVVSVNPGGAAGTGPASVLRAYALGYATSANTGRSQLTRIARYGRDAVVDAAGTVTAGSLLDAQTFAYAGGRPAFPDELTWTGLSDASGWADPSNYSTIQTPDIDGDGRNDLCARANAGIACWRFTGATWTPFPNIQGTPAMSDAGGWNQPQYYATIAFPDLNGDGKADVCGRAPSGLACWLNDGAASPSFKTAVPRMTWSDGTFPFSDALGWAAEHYYRTIQFADVNGDGRDDVCSRSSNGVSCWLSNGTSWGANVKGPAWTNEVGWTDPANYKTIKFADINGDGKADVCGRGDASGIFCYLSNGNGFDAQAWSGPGWSDAAGWGSPRFYSTIQLADVNGDGKADICGRAADGMHCHLAIGSARTQAPFAAFSATLILDGTLSDAAGYDAEQYYSSIHFADVDGDGRADMCWRGSAGVYCARQRNAGFARIMSGVLPGLSTANGWSDPANYNTLKFVDVDGNGKADVLARADAGLRLYKSAADGFEAMSAVTNNGLGGSQTVTYTASSAFANTNNPPLSYAVTSLAISDGRGTTAVHAYSYNGGRYDWAERRSLGFRYMKHTLPAIAGDGAAPYEESWFMQQPYACVGKVDLARRSNGAGRRLEEVDSAYTATGAAAGPYTCLLDVTTTMTFQDVAGAACTDADHARCKRVDLGYDYDAYGNVTAAFDWGDFYDGADDDVTTAHTYALNPTAYLVGGVRTTQIYAGIGTGGALLGETHFFHDGATSLDTPPTAGLVTRELRWASGRAGGDAAAGWVATAREHDAYGNVVADVDALGNRTARAYDAALHTEVVAVSDPLGHTTTLTVDPVCGVPLTETDANAQVTRHQYDAFCRPTRTDGPLGGFSLRLYSALGNATTQSVRLETPPVAGLAGNLYVMLAYDGLGRQYYRRSRGADGAAASEIFEDTTFDGRGNVRSETRPHLTGEAVVPTTYDYDALDRRVAATLPDGTRVTDSYDLWTTTSSDETGQQTVETDDADGEVVSHTERADGAATITYRRDPLGRVVGVTDPAGNLTTQELSSLGDVLAETDPDRGRMVHGYDAEGQLVTSTDARGVTTTFAYDPLGRLLARSAAATADSGPAPRAVSYGYDEPRAGFFNVGHMTSMTDPAGVETYDYDAAGHLARKTRTLAGRTYTFLYAYDAGGRLTGTKLPDGDTLGDDPATAAAEPALRYDGAGRLLALPGYVTSIGYNPAGEPVQIANANGTTATRAYDARREWLASLRTTRGAAVVQDLAYARDPAGRITGVASSNAREARGYTYSAGGRLLRATAGSAAATFDDQTFGYDVLGNLRSNSRLGGYDYPAAGGARPHAPTAVAGRAHAYDAAGNTLDDGRRRYAWDADGQLARVTMPDGSVTSFVYDGEGERLSQSGPGGTTLTIGDDYEVAPDGTVTKYLSIGDDLVAKKVGAAVFWLHTDHLGSVRVVTDAAGAEVRRDQYRAYGGTLESSGDQPQSRTFTGERADATGLVYLHARYYDPEEGRFLSPDSLTPSEKVIGLNRYAYADDDPIDFSDPTGHFSWSKLARTVTVIGVSLAADVLCGPACGAAATFVVGMAWDYGEARATHKHFDWKESAKENAIDAALALATGGVAAGGERIAMHAASRHVAKLSTKGVAGSVAKSFSRGAPRHREAPVKVLRAAFKGMTSRGTRKAAVLDVQVHLMQEGMQHYRRPKATPKHAGSVRRHPHHFRPAHRSARAVHDRAYYNAMAAQYRRTHPPAPKPRASRGCFVAGTPIAMADGTSKPIELVRAGDWVMSFDEQTGATVAAPVERLFVHEDWSREESTVLVDGHLRATADHPFFVDGAWRRAGDLTVGAALTRLSSPGGGVSLEPARSLATLPGADTVYNLEVGTYHTYFADGVLVHNKMVAM